MDVYAILLIVFWLLLAVCIIVLVTLRFTRSSSTVQVLAPSFATLFTDMTNQDNILLTGTKDFRILSKGRKAPSVDSFTFNDASTFTNPFAQDQLVGVVFHATQNVELTSLQLVNELIPDKTSKHIVALYDFDSKEQLVSTTIDAATDFVDSNGFLTKPLVQAVLLNANQKYIVMSQAFAPPDNYMVGNGIITSPLVFTDGAQTLNTTTMGYPNDIVSGIVPFFVGFQTRTPSSEVQSIFAVNLANGGYVSNPPGYLRGMILSVPNDQGSILIQPGTATAQDDTTAIVLQLPISILPQQGINGLDEGKFTANTWYNVFIIASNDSSFPTSGLLSLGRVAPQVLPTNYQFYRRIGSVFTTGVDTFDPMQQAGQGSNRTTTFTGDLVSHRFVTQGTTTDDYVTVSQIPFVPPTATSMLVSVRGLMVTSAPFDFVTPINAILRFRPALSTVEGIWTLGITNDVATFGQIVVGLDTNPIPHSIEYRLFPQPGTGGSIPNSDFPLSKFTIDCYVSKFTEVL